MKKFLFAAALASFASTAFAANVSISVGQPGFFGQINIGGYPPPQVIYQQPVIVRREPAYRSGPVYLRVPPGYESHWSEHCGAYRACGRPVYFVRDDWYRQDYVPRYQREHPHGHHHRHGHDDHGHGNGNGNGHDHGHDHDQGHH